MYQRDRNRHAVPILPVQQKEKLTFKRTQTEVKKGQDSEASESKTFLKLHSRKETQRPLMQSCQDLETSNV